MGAESRFREDAVDIRKGISLTGLPTNTNITVCGLDGKVVYSETPNAANVTVPLNNGLYIVKIGNALSRKMYIEK